MTSYQKLKKRLEAAQADVKHLKRELYNVTVLDESTFEHQLSKAVWREVFNTEKQIAELVLFGYSDSSSKSFNK